jgi:hypothetical protein
MKPYLHELKIFSKDLESDVVKEIKLNQKLQIEVTYDEESNCILTLKDVIVPAMTEIVISFGMRKTMMLFEEYPNDPNRGFNIPQMPLYYKVGNEASWKSGVS